MTNSGIIGFVAGALALGVVLFFGHPAPVEVSPESKIIGGLTLPEFPPCTQTDGDCREITPDIPEVEVTPPEPPPYVQPTLPARPAPAPPLPRPRPRAKASPKAPTSLTPLTYYSVTKGGGQGEPIACKTVQPYTQGRPIRQSAAMAKRLGVTLAELATYFVCVKD